jgi:predicted transcriptional regulator
MRGLSEIVEMNEKAAREQSKLDRLLNAAASVCSRYEIGDKIAPEQIATLRRALDAFSH